ncbi:hypothetical protein IFU25_07975 [Pantoea agglomerans]|uniref:hypothetical protein n=1 Tax=Enterobacter agglomerans TaxID=549 RepID=UPI0017858FAE|nr:hypothetical protein [Pantoea agglomerans]MBD8181638.1 hypothetical protein [Pantoea agglomerans]
MSEVKRFDMRGNTWLSENGHLVSYEDYAALKAERDALAAENVLMLKLLTDISENHVEYFSEGEGYMFAGVPLDYVSEINTYVSRDVNAENPFPATDAYLNSVRAEGVDKAIAHLHKKFEGTGHIGVPVMALESLAAKLRAGKDGE